MSLSPLACLLAKRLAENPAIQPVIQEQLALRSAATLDLWIQGIRLIPLEKLPLLCYCLGVSDTAMLLKELKFRHPPLEECLKELKSLSDAVEQEMHHLLSEIGCD